MAQTGVCSIETCRFIGRAICEDCLDLSNCALCFRSACKACRSLEGDFPSICNVCEPVDDENQVPLTIEEEEQILLHFHQMHGYQE